MEIDRVLLEGIIVECSFEQGDNRHQRKVMLPANKI